MKCRIKHDSAILGYIIIIYCFIILKPRNFLACLRGGGGPQAGEVTCLGVVTLMSIIIISHFNP